MKSKLRDELLTQRLAMTQDAVIQASLSIIYQLVKHPLFIQSNHIGLFHPIKNEPNLTSFINLSYKQFYLPVVKEPTLIYSRFSKDTPLVKSPLNILEPSTGLDESKSLDLVIIPAIAIDKHKYRLGFGKGYFDRFLAAYPSLKVLAVIYPFQHIESFEHDLHDMPVDDVIISD
jgi:5-formyltetrahydrofolate cyclo-ligase